MQTFSHDIVKAEEALKSAKRQNNEQRTNTIKKNLDKANKDLKKAKEKAKKDRIEAEKQNIKGMRVGSFEPFTEDDYIIQDANCRVRPRWQPLDMRYGMNSRK
jgi:hypothetical protein